MGVVYIEKCVYMCGDVLRVEIVKCAAWYSIPEPDNHRGGAHMQVRMHAESTVQ